MVAIPSLIGTSLGPYDVQALLGHGGMANVYRGFDRNLRRPVAIKVLSDAAEAQPGLAERFRQEALLIASLRHPNVVHIYDLGEQDGYTYMVQELLPGPTLEQRLAELRARGERMGREEVLTITKQLAAALDAAHAAGIIHRDVKPSNAMWRDAGTVVLTDFGVAKNTLAQANQTQAGVVFGTPNYIAPEQAQGLPLTPASDIYALGAVLYEMIAGQPPFASDTPMGVLFDHIQTPPPPLRPLRADLPPAVEEVVLRALAKDPAARFGSAGELVRALEQAWSAASAVGSPAPGIHDQATRVWEPPAAVAPRPASAPPRAVASSPLAPATPASVPGSRGRLALLALLLALLLLGGGALALRGAGRAAAPTAHLPIVAAPPTALPVAAPATAQPAATPAPKPSPVPTAAPAAPAPANPLDLLRALLVAGSADGRAGKNSGDLFDRLDKAQQALADGNKQRAADELREMQQALQKGAREGQIDAAFANQALAGIDAIANTYGLSLAPPNNGDHGKKDDKKKDDK